jgi:excisionase family DNA binding protein
VLWNALAPELWRRTTIAVYRALGRLVGLQEGELRQLVRISYAKVAEFQRRGAIHFHAVIRLDAATECRCAGCLSPPPEPFTAALLEEALRLAVPAVRVPCPSLEEGGMERYARWGTQLDARNITRDDQAGELSAEQVAGYIAKYATKATESFGAGLDRRLGADDLEHLNELPTHVAELVRAAWGLGGRPELEGLRLRAWAHMLGFRGHWSTKSRRYSTTMGALRRARVTFAKRRRARDGIPLDAWDRPEDDQAVLVLATWSYVATGYASEGERWLALSAAARAREQRRVAWEELRTMAAGAGVQDMTDKLLTMEEAAEWLCTTPRHMRRLASERRIAYRKVGRFVRFHPDDLVEYVAAQRAEATRPRASWLRAVGSRRR